MLILLANSSHPYCSTRELSIISNLIPCNGLFGCSINFNSYIILLKSDYTRKKRKIQKEKKRKLLVKAKVRTKVDIVQKKAILN